MDSLSGVALGAHRREDSGGAIATEAEPRAVGIVAGLGRYRRQGL
jgi:hypothetical protein